MAGGDATWHEDHLVPITRGDRGARRLLELQLQPGAGRRRQRRRRARSRCRRRTPARRGRAPGAGCSRSSRSRLQHAESAEEVCGACDRVPPRRPATTWRSRCSISRIRTHGALRLAGWRGPGPRARPPPHATMAIASDESRGPSRGRLARGRTLVDAADALRACRDRRARALARARRARRSPWRWPQRQHSRGPMASWCSGSIRACRSTRRTPLLCRGRRRARSRVGARPGAAGRRRAAGRARRGARRTGSARARLRAVAGISGRASRPGHRLRARQPRLSSRSSATATLLGRPVREALPEVAGQGFVELLDRVYRTGEPFVGNEVPIQLQIAPGGALE